MKKELFLAYDCETGGLNPLTDSLLSVYLAIYSLDFKRIAHMLLLLKHSTYHVETGALRVNGINLVEHDSQAIPEGDCEVMLKSFLDSEDATYVPVGHNVEFDTAFLDANFAGFRNRISHRKLDTAVIGRFLKLQGKLPSDLSGLETYCNHFNIPIRAHDPQEDTEATVRLLQEFIKL